MTVVTLPARSMKFLYFKSISVMTRRNGREVFMMIGEMNMNGSISPRMGVPCFVKGEDNFRNILTKSRHW